MAASDELAIGDKKVRLSHLEKVFYPKTGFTKGELIDYYVRIAPVLLPHLADRPLTLKRYPDGVEGEFFYQKEAPDHRPDWFRTAAVPVKERTINYCLVNDLASLVWVANMADIEMHPLLAKRKDVRRPTALAFDLDPGAPADARDCARVALRLRDLVQGWHLDSYVKTSGSKGMQLYVPLNTPVTYDDTKPFAHEVAKRLERETPKLVTSSMSKSVRPGKVFVDWSQNDEHKTTVCVYSLRARERPTVSTPLSWDEVERALAKDRLDEFVFEATDVLRRVDEMGDLFAPVQSQKQRLPRLGPAAEAAPNPPAARATHGRPTLKSAKTADSL